MRKAPFGSPKSWMLVAVLLGATFFGSDFILTILRPIAEIYQLNAPAA